jgi:hypothetical protein
MLEALEPLISQLNADDPNARRVAELEAEISRLKQSPVHTPTKRSASQADLSPPPFTGKLSITSYLKKQDDPLSGGWFPQSEPLSQNCPKSDKQSDVRAWMKEYKKKLSKEDNAKLDQFVQSVSNKYNEASAATKPSLPDVAAKWGLPVALAAKISEDSLLQIIAMAAFSVA